MWEEFRNEMLENKKAILKERVDDGTLTQEEADQFLANIEEMQDYCLENGGGFGMMTQRKWKATPMAMWTLYWKP